MSSQIHSPAHASGEMGYAFCQPCPREPTMPASCHGKISDFESKVVSVLSIAFVDSYEGDKVIFEPC